ncbi:MAG: hypothetical protein FWF18_05925 [Dehalococcoidia bacterium]|nr:hypothetical protein [Dehalococcoidia bacterium]
MSAEKLEVFQRLVFIQYHWLILSECANSGEPFMPYKYVIDLKEFEAL